MLTEQEKYSLIETKGITLNGKPAKISGAKLSFAEVYHQQPGCFVCETWSWDTAKRIIEERNGQFFSDHGKG